MNTKSLSLLTLLTLISACLQADTLSGQHSITPPSSRAVPYTAAERALILQQGELEEKSQDAFDEGNYAKAEDLARQAQAVPTTGFAEMKLAQALYQEGKDQEALQTYQYVVHHEDTNPASLLPYAILELRAGDWAKALNAYKASLWPRQDDIMIENSNFDLNNPQPDDLATAIHIQLGRLDNPGFLADSPVFSQRAMSEYKQALAIEPNSPIAQLYYAKGLAAVGKKAEAKAALKAVSDSTQGDIKSEADEALSRM